jgi:hypothetical protein
MSIIKFILEIFKKYLGLIIVLFLIYIIYKSYIALDDVSVRGGYYTLYKAVGKAINFVFDRLPKLFIKIPQFKIPKFGFLLRKIPKIPDVPQVKIPSINQPGNCSIPFPNPKLVIDCVFEGGKYIKKGLSKAFGWMCITENSLILMSDNSYKMIKDLNIGDEILNNSGKTNKIFFIHKDCTDVDIEIYGINDVEPFFTESHPIISGIDNNIVLSINPEITLCENPERKGKIKQLEIGDTVLINNKKVLVEKITKNILKKNNFVYDLTFEEMDDISYIANNVAIESQEPNYCNALGNIISEISIIYYEKREDKEYIKNKILDFINNNKKYVSENLEINIEEKLKLKSINKEKLKKCNHMIKNTHNDLGNFMNELWVNYYNHLSIFKNITINNLNKLVYSNI